VLRGPGAVAGTPIDIAPFNVMTSESDPVKRRAMFREAIANSSACDVASGRPRPVALAVTTTHGCRTSGQTTSTNPTAR